MPRHETVVVAAGLHLVRLHLLEIQAALLVDLHLVIIELIGSRAGRAEVGVQRLAAPGRLDEEDGLLQLLLHVDPEGKLGADLAPIFGGILPCSVAGGERAMTFPAANLASIEIRDPHLVTDSWSAVRGAHLLENGSGLGVHPQMFEGRDLGMPFHVGLPGQDEDLEWGLGRSAMNGNGGGRQGDHEQEEVDR